MTNEEAIKILEYPVKKWSMEWDEREDGLSYYEALDMAISALQQQERFGETNKALTMEELRQMDGEPVWLVNQNGGRWVIMSGAYLWDSRKNADYGKTWLAYRQKPEEGTV